MNHGLMNKIPLYINGVCLLNYQAPAGSHDNERAAERIVRPAAPSRGPNFHGNNFRFEPWRHVWSLAH